MANSVTASVVVRFQSADLDEQTIFNAEVDGREDGLNAGKTSFNPGDAVNILLFRTDNTTLDYYDSSHGSLTKQGSGASPYAVEEEFITFAGENSTTLSKPYVEGLTYTWIGTDLGTISPGTSGATLTLPDQEEEGQYVGVAKVSYTSKAEIFKLDNTLYPGEDEYDIACLFAGTGP